jgi:homoserine kinase
MPETLALVADLRDHGHAAVLSGAGPSVLVLCVGDPDGALGERATELTTDPPEGWNAMAVGIAHQGTRGGNVGPGSRAARTVLD